MFKKKPVVVLGAGPAGLLAAHAAERRGREVTVISAADAAGNPKKSQLHGCQYLHSSIPGLTYSVDGLLVRYLLDGTTEGYRRKVYGDAWTGEVSPDEFGPEREHRAWDLRQVYDVLWARCESRIAGIDITPYLARALSRDKSVVLCTIPAPALCMQPDEHQFATQDVWAMGTVSTHWREFLDVRSEIPPRLPYYAPENTVLCNGHDAPRWYRAATVFGQSTLEWPDGPKPPITGIARVQKPLSTDCDCHVGKDWHRLGRYGRWQKGVLVHEAYEGAMEALS